MIQDDLELQHSCLSFLNARVYEAFRIHLSLGMRTVEVKKTRCSGKCNPSTKESEAGGLEVEAS